MRRKQTTLIVTSIMIFSLLTLSQLPAIQSVENVHPEDANQGPPPVTDTDRDGIPDVWEQQFGKSWEAISIDNFLDARHLNHRVEYKYGLMQKESSDLLKSFFEKRR